MMRGAGDEETKAGAGDPPEMTSPNPPKRRPRGGNQLDANMRNLVRQIGKDKLAPDITAQEVYYSRSIRIRRLILEFLIMSEGTSWANLPELHARAANYAGCSSVTAARWIHQFTRVGAKHRLIEAIDHWLVERRD